MGENTVIWYVNQKSKKTLGQKIDDDISSEVMQFTISFYVLQKKK